MPPWFDALDCLRHAPDNLRHAHSLVEDFSRRRGALARVQLSAPDRMPMNVQATGSRRSRVFELTDAYRYWSDPIASGALSLAGTPLPDALPTGQDGWRLGGAALSVARRFASAYGGVQTPGASQPRDCTARLYSRLGGFSEAGAWHAALAELAQDLYLGDLLGVLPRHEETPVNAREIGWPTLSGPSLMCLEHGLGVPVMQINWARSAIGFMDVTPESLICLEGRLFSNWLLKESRLQSPTCTDRELDDRLTPALADWVRILRKEPFIAGTGLWASWFNFLQRQSMGCWSGGCSFVDDTSLRLLRAELEQMSRASPGQLASVPLETWTDAYPFWFNMLDGMVTLQDNIRYGGGCLPIAGIERAYLNSLLRNMSCDALGLHEPAEIAQFDLLLNTCRNARNHGFNDYGVNRGLEQHHIWVAGSQNGNQSPARLALKALTDRLSKIRDTSGDDDCLFTLDEPSRATAGVSAR